MNSNVSWKIPFNNLAPAISEERKDIDEAIKRVLDSGVFINGSEVYNFSNELSKYTGVQYVIPCANGTDALMLALLAYRDIPRHVNRFGNDVYTVANSAPATVAAIRRAGFYPRFLDINTSGLISYHNHKDNTSEYPEIHLPVNLYGQVKLYRKRPNEIIIEDGAQALGNYNFCRSEADVWTTSFYPTKNLGALGDGGAVLTNDQKVADKIRLLTNYGLDPDKFMIIEHGFNSRLDEIQAAILRVRLKNLDTHCNERRSLAKMYDLVLDPFVKHREYNMDENYHLYTILVKDDKRTALQKYLHEQGIQTAIHYVKSVDHGLGENSNTEYFQKSVLSLPLWPGMKRAEVAYVAGSVNDFLYA
jgi:dTDP-4-amino-4,6-dideoxygalactose transaminase